MNSVELFAGAGGLALGIQRAGFRPLAIVERDSDACATLRHNAQHDGNGSFRWPICEEDVRKFDYASISEDVDLLAAGVPCQPFSVAGKHKGHLDERNMFPELVRAIRELKPLAVLVENVRGLTRPSFARYFGYIELMLMYPEIARKETEEWFEHAARLERYHTRGKRDGLWYRVVHRVLNSADFGVPQKRERLFMVAIRADLGAEWSFPSPTHSFDALLWDQFETGEYWDRHGVSKRNTGKPNGQNQGRVKGLSNMLIPPQYKPWKTIRDAFSTLPPLAKKRTFDEPSLTHFYIPGAKSYVGHTGSPLDEPAKTLKLVSPRRARGREYASPSRQLGKILFNTRECASANFPGQFCFSKLVVGKYETDRERGASYFGGTSGHETEGNIVVPLLRIAAPWVTVLTIR